LHVKGSVDADSALFLLVFKLHQRAYEYDTPVARSEFGLSRQAWLWQALLLEALRSQGRRLSKSEITSVLSAFKSLRTNVSWLRLANKALDQLTQSDVIELFSLLEKDISSEPSLGGHSKHSRSVRARGLLSRYLLNSGFPKAERIKLLFKTKLPKDPRDHRKLISDQAITDGEDLLPPVSALEHSDLADLRKKVEQTLERPIDMILAASRMTLEACDAATRRLQSLVTEPLNRQAVELLRAHAQYARNPVLASRFAESLPVHELAHAYLHIFQTRNTTDPPMALGLFRAREVRDYLCARIGVEVQTAPVFLPMWFDVRPMLACLLILICHTQWNSNSVLELREEWLTSKVPPLEMRSYKSRTNTMTPMVLVDRSDSEAIMALSFLLARLDLMKRLGLVPQSESRLWLSDQSVRARRPTPVVSWGSALKRFCVAHGLPRFSLEQLRVQALTSISVRAGGLSAARNAASHASLRTTSLYIDQLIAHRLSAAVNLEFQRRLESEIIASSENSIGSSALFRPIGDGAQCADPATPPFEDYLEKGICSAKNCHTGSGCPNRRLVVNADSVEEVLRMSSYYRRNWSRLYDETRDAFIAYHLPAMTFHFAYLGVLERGPYAHLVNEARARLEAENENA
jgi:hypothetical protein